MAATRLDIYMEQGATFEWLILVYDVNGLPLDMATLSTPAGVRGSIRKRYTDTTATETFNVTLMSGPTAASAAHLTAAEIASLEPAGSGSCYACQPQKRQPYQRGPIFMM
jgi:hypothetical protein